MSLNHVIIVELTALPAWLALSRAERAHVVTAQVEPALAASACRVRWVDAEAFTARCSDVLVVETADLRAWNHLWERVRDTDLFAVPYFRLEAIIPGVEDGYAEFEASQAAEGAA